MKQLKYIISICLIFILSSCNNDEDTTTLTVNFKHYWDISEVNSTDFNQLKYTNQFGNVLSISKLRYLISNIELQTSKGQTIPLKNYLLVDVTTNENTSFSVTVPQNTYIGLSFVFGFNEIDNIDGAYKDLNSTSWNWPEMLGGGYHFMQFEGKYEDSGMESPFAYHHGTARASTGVFEQNYFNVELDGFSINSEKNIYINMNISEWFKNPNTWDLNQYSINLMPNYDAQKMMNQNGKTVFSLSENPL